MKHFSDHWIKDWCQENGWTDLFIERYNNYWAFPPGAVIPEPIPPKTLREIKLEKGLCQEERLWLIIATLVTIISLIIGYYFKCPMPLVFAFAFDAIVAGQLEVEEIY